MSALVASSGASGPGATAALALAERSQDKRLGGELVSVPRTSDLFAPIVKLEGHSAAVSSVEFSPDGSLVASGSYDKTVLLWRPTATGVPNYGKLSGHGNAVTQAAWSPDAERIASSSADKTARVWDTLSGECLGRLTDRAFVNCCAYSGEGVVAFGGDSRRAQLWDPREGATRSFAVLAHDFEVAACCFVGGAGPSLLLTGSVDGVVRAWDARKHDEVVWQMSNAACDGVVTGIAADAATGSVVTNCTNGAVCRWDARPFVAGGDEARFKGAFLLGPEQAPPANRSNLLLRCAVKAGRVSAGLADATVPVWDLDTGVLEFRLPGHKGPVHDVDLHPTQPILASASVDTTIFLGELDPK